LLKVEDKVGEHDPIIVLLCSIVYLDPFWGGDVTGTRFNVVSSGGGGVVCEHSPYGKMNYQWLIFVCYNLTIGHYFHFTIDPSLLKSSLN